MLFRSLQSEIRELCTSSCCDGQDGVVSLNSFTCENSVNKAESLPHVLPVTCPSTYLEMASLSSTVELVCESAVLPRASGAVSQIIDNLAIDMNPEDVPLLPTSLIDSESVASIESEGESNDETDNDSNNYAMSDSDEDSDEDGSDLDDDYLTQFEDRRAHV